VLEKGRHERDSENVLLLSGLALAVAGLVVYVVVARYHIRQGQLVEAGLYLLMAVTAVAAPASWKLNAPGIRKKRDPFVITEARDRKIVAKAWKRRSVVLGYDMNLKPWLWSDRVRTEQSVMVGMSGSGQHS
jgi:hypothetical protein